MLLLAGYGLHTGRRASPAVQLNLIAHVKTGVPMVLTTLAAVVLFGVLFLIPVFLQDLDGNSALATGLIVGFALESTGRRQRCRPP